MHATASGATAATALTSSGPPVLPMSPHSRHAPRNCDLPSSGAASAPRVITMPDPRPLPHAMSAITRATDTASVASGSSRQATAIDSTTGTATTIRPRVSISQPPGHMNATSRAAAPAKMRDVVDADSPTWSAHSGRRLSRSERLAPRITTAVPSVASSRRCAAITVHTPRWPRRPGGGALLLAEVGHRGREQGGEHGHRGAQPEDARQVGDRDQPGPDERPDEHPDAVGPAQQRHRPRPVALRDDVDHEALPGDEEQRPAHAAEQDPDRQPQDRVGQRREGHRAGVDEARAHQRPPLADPRDQRARRQAGEELPDPEEGDDRGRDADVGPEVAGPQGEHRQHRAVADGGDDRGPVRHEEDVAEAEVLRGPRGHRHILAAPSGEPARPDRRTNLSASWCCLPRRAPVGSRRGRTRPRPSPFPSTSPGTGDWLAWVSQRCRDQLEEAQQQVGAGEGRLRRTPPSSSSRGTRPRPRSPTPRPSPCGPRSTPTRPSATCADDLSQQVQKYVTELGLDRDLYAVFDRLATSSDSVLDADGRRRARAHAARLPPRRRRP